ncbi:MAG: AAA family ATPase [Anaerolineaceae bacterium]|nr:AAA family ATPase [Anaerolineaceae bacterium]
MHLLNVKIHSDRFPSRRFYPFNIQAMDEPQELVFHRPVVFFLGENGSGKSTLLEAIARRCGITLWDRPRRHLAHNNPFETRLQDYVSATWSREKVPGSLFRAETFRDLGDLFDDVALCDPGRLQYHGGQILNTLSHGQGILSYLSHRCRRKGLYLLDEPEAALSPASQIHFLKLLQRFELEGNAQFIITTHSPILLAYPGAQILSFEPPRIREVAYEQTAHYRLYTQFLLNPAAFIGAGQDESMHPLTV